MVAVALLLAHYAAGSVDLSGGRGALVLFAVFLVSGMVISALPGCAIGDMTEAHAPLDRVAGAMLGVGRTILLAVLMVVMIFIERLPDREPDWLSQSRLRPVSAAGQQGLRALPPDVIAYIDRLKKERGLEPV